MPQSLTIATQHDMEALGRRLAGHLRPGMLVALTGGLGAGKSTLARAIVRALAQNETLDVPSPTFTLVQTYETPGGTLHHFDLYRLKTAEDIFDLGWDEARGDIMLVEWPDRAGPYLPADAVEITIEQGAADARIVTIAGGGIIYDRD